MIKFNMIMQKREFTMAEIEHFVDPNDKSHSKFNEIENVKVVLYSAANQIIGKPSEKMTIGKAVEMVKFVFLRFIIFSINFSLNK